MTRPEISKTPKALILGATGGIGSRLTADLASKGWRLALLARDEDRLGSLASEHDALALPGDARNSGALADAFEKASGTLDGLDAVACCVGSILLKPAHLTTDDEWSDVLATNLTTAFHTVREAARHMRKGGSIALVSSAAARMGLPNHGGIAAAKAGVEALVRSAAADYSARGLRFNAVAPGLVRTPLTRSITENEKALATSEAMHPLGRIGEPEDVAQVLAWLLAPSSGWVTGQVFPVDGGLSSVRPRTPTGRS